ncbi:UxaA family hydrolase [Microbaculum sp. FT89]|uniref:UxaA family hydrolase n=1 Tax=Microbaculum sp. FT89 TaxID=3447298 RepID=UPI003F52DB3C
MSGTFLGYARPDGSAGVRNRVAILSIVDTAAGTARRIGAMVRGATVITTSFGRGQIGYDYEMTVRALAGLGSNANVAAVLVVGLEPASAEIVAAQIRPTGKPVEIVTVMGDGGPLSAALKGARWVADQVIAASRQQREPLPLSTLTVGVECGGSDTTSGIASNPAVGWAADALVDAGGTVVLSETSEWMGGEHLLAERAVDPEIGRKIIEAVGRVEQDAIARGVDIRGQQPTPDNIAGGLTTIEEKTLGAIRKAGTRPIVGFLEFAQRPVKSGLNLMDTAAPAAESMTALAAGGCQIIMFSTGQGNPSGDAIAPTLKVSGNAGTIARLGDAIDVQVTEIIKGTGTLDDAGRRVQEAMLAVAEGMLVRSEVYNEEVTTITRFEKSL